MKQINWPLFALMALWLTVIGLACGCGSTTYTERAEVRERPDSVLVPGIRIDTTARTTRVEQQLREPCPPEVVKVYREHLLAQGRDVPREVRRQIETPVAVSTKMYFGFTQDGVTVEGWTDTKDSSFSASITQNDWMHRYQARDSIMQTTVEKSKSLWEKLQDSMTVILIGLAVVGWALAIFRKKKP